MSFDDLGSDVPLEEDILKKKIDFVKTWLEWAAENREQKVQFLSASGGQSVNFVVANNITFFITNVHIDLSTETGATGGASSANLFIEGTSKRLGILNHREINQQPLVSTYQMSFPMPIKIQANEKITFTVTGNINQALGHAIVSGFIIPKRISP